MDLSHRYNTKLTPEVVQKLEDVFSLDGTVEEACFYANVSRQTYYNWIDEFPELVERFDTLRQKPYLKARQTIVQSLGKESGAQWYLERKKKKEFAQRTEVTGEEGQAVQVQVIDWATAQEQQKKTKKQFMRYEYTFIFVDDTTTRKQQLDEFNAIGGEGWRFVTFIGSTGAMFERAHADNSPAV